MCGVDRGQRIVLWNDSAEAMLGYSSREVSGRHCFEVLRGADEHGLRFCRHGCPILGLARRGETAPTVNVQILRKDGDLLWVSLSTIRIPAPWRDNAVLVHLFRDVTRARACQAAVDDLLARVAPCLGAVPPADTVREGSPQNAALTRREVQVLRLLASGTSTAALADRLSISPATVRNHVHNILAKLGAHSRLEAVTIAWRRGVL